MESGRCRVVVGEVVCATDGHYVETRMRGIALRLSLSEYGHQGTGEVEAQAQRLRQ